MRSGLNSDDTVRVSLLDQPLSCMYSMDGCRNTALSIEFFKNSGGFDFASSSRKKMFQDFIFIKSEELKIFLF